MQELILIPGVALKASFVNWTVLVIPTLGFMTPVADMRRSKAIWSQQSKDIT